MQQNIIFSFILFSFLAFRLQADTPVGYETFYPKIFEDRTQVLSLQEVMSERYARKFLYYSELAVLRKDADYWGKIEVKNTSDFVEKRFLKFGRDTRISCYVFDENQQVTIHKIGKGLPYAQQHQFSNIIPINIAPHSQCQVIFRLKNPNAFPDFSLSLKKEDNYSLKIWESDFFIIALLLLAPLGLTIFLIPHSFFWRVYFVGKSRIGYFGLYYTF